MRNRMKLEIGLMGDDAMRTRWNDRFDYGNADGNVDGGAMVAMISAVMRRLLGFIVDAIAVRCGGMPSIVALKLLEMMGSAW